jgi:hypothetical protein
LILSLLNVSRGKNRRSIWQQKEEMCEAAIFLCEIALIGIEMKSETNPKVKKRGIHF